MAPAVGRAEMALYPLISNEKSKRVYPADSACDRDCVMTVESCASVFVHRPFDFYGDNFRFKP